MDRYIATATAKVNHSDGYTSCMQLPYVEFTSHTHQSAIEFAHDYYGRLAGLSIRGADVLVDIHVSVEGL